MSLYTREGVEELEQEKEGFRAEAEGLDNFRIGVKRNDPSTTEEFYKIFYVTVWNGSDYSEVYSEEDSLEAFQNEFGSSIVFEDPEKYISRTEELIKGRKKTVSAFQEMQEGLENYLERLELTDRKVEEVENCYRFDTWHDIESAWNRLEHYEHKLADIAVQRQNEQIFDEDIQEYLDLEVEWPVLADITYLRDKIHENKSDILGELPVEDEEASPELRKTAED